MSSVRLKFASSADKWSKYWQSLINDYKDVIVECGKNAKEHPLKTTVWSVLVAFGVYCHKTNPDDYRNCVIDKNIELSLIGSPIRNSDTENYLECIESYFNAGLIKRVNFGVCSVIMLNYKNPDICAYKYQCPSVQPTYLELIRNNVLDVGFLGRWWFLEEKMRDCDVNFTEWDGKIK